MAREVALIDDLLLRAAAGGKSGEELERATGIPAAQAVQHVKHLLASRDIWSQVEQQQLLLAELQELKESLQESAIRQGDADSARLLLKTLETIGKRLDAQKLDVSEAMLRLSEYQSRVMIRAMDSALNFAKGQLAEQYPDVDVVKLDELVADGLQRAKYEIMEEENR